MMPSYLDAILNIWKSFGMGEKGIQERFFHILPYTYCRLAMHTTRLKMHTVQSRTIVLIKMVLKYGSGVVLHLHLITQSPKYILPNQFMPRFDFVSNATCMHVQ